MRTTRSLILSPYLVVSHACPPSPHPPLPHIHPLHHACPPLCHAHPPATTHVPLLWQPRTPLPREQNHTRLWKHNLAPTSLRAVKIQEMLSRCLFTTNEIFRVPTFPNWQNSRISPGIFSLLAQLFHERLAYVIIIPPNETWSLMSLKMWMKHYERHWQDHANFHEIL